MTTSHNRANNLRSRLIKFAKTKPCTIQECSLISQGFTKFLMEKVKEGHEVLLPARLGKLLVEGKKITPQFDENGNLKGLAPDWVNTKKLWDSDEEAKKNKVLVYHFNEHTSGIRYRYKWNKYSCYVKNKSLYSFRLSRTNKRELNKKILEGKEYRVI